MPIKVVCPQCNKSLNAPDSAAGRTAACPKCKGQLRIPGTPAAKAAATSANGTVAPSASKSSRAAKAGVPVATVVKSTAARPVIVKALPTGNAAVSVAHNAPPEIEDLPALDSLGDADPFAGLSMEALGGDPLAGEALSSSPLAAMPVRRRNIDLLPIAVIAGTVLVVCLIGGGLYVLLRGMGGGASAEWLKFMPDDAQMIVHADVQAIRSSGLYEKLKQANPAFEEQIRQGLRGTSLRFEDIATVAVGGSFQDRQKFVAVVRMNRSVSEAEMRSTKSTRQETIGQFTVHYEDAFAGARVDDDTVVAGTPELVKTVLSRNGPAKLPAALQEAVDDADFSADFTMAMTLQGLPGMNRSVPGAPFNPSQVESVAVSADLGSSIDLAASVCFTDSGTASDLKDKIDQQMSMMKGMMGNLPPQAQEFSTVLDSLSISRSGRKLVAEVSIPQSLIDSATNGMRMPALPTATPLSAPATKSSPRSVPGRRKPAQSDPNLPATAPSRGLF
jgi:hypothetical protein